MNELKIFLLCVVFFTLGVLISHFLDKAYKCWKAKRNQMMIKDTTEKEYYRDLSAWARKQGDK